MRGEYFYIPLEQATSPTNGEAICDAWWTVHPELGVCFYAQVSGYGRSVEPSPQCHENEHTARTLTERYKPGHEVRCLPVVFTGHARRALSKMRADRAKALLGNDIQKEAP